MRWTSLIRFLEVSISQVGTGDVDSFPCDPNSKRDREKCTYYCELKRFRYGYCGRFGAGFICKCVE